MEYDPLLFDIHFSEIKLLAKLAFDINRKYRIYDIDEIIDNVCEYYQLTREELFAVTRKREIVMARQLAMYFSKKFTKLTLNDIGFKIGRKDHATVLHSIKTVKNLMFTDSRFREEIKNLQLNISYNNFINK